MDAVIIGGSYAGLSAAMALGRSLRHVGIIDSGSPCNRQTPRSHNFLTHDGKAPAEIAALARQQVEAYDTVTFYHDTVLQAQATGGGFIISTASGKHFSAKKIILATGIKDNLPGIPGLADCWGISVVHCPYCHGYEYRGQPTGLLVNGEMALHYVSLIYNLTHDLKLFTNGKAALDQQLVGKLQERNIEIIETEIAAINHQNGYLSEVVLKDGRTLPLNALYAAVPFEQHSAIPVSLGCELSEQGFIKVDSLQKTTVAGVYACGDNSGSFRSVANAVASGNLAGAAVNRELATAMF